MLDHFMYSLNATFPVFAVMVLGWILKRIGFLTDEFVRVANKLVFKVALPCMLFIEISEMELKELLDGKFIAYCAIVTLVTILCVWALAKLLLRDKTQVGSFVQGSYRSSAAILGAALITNIYGDAGYAPLMILASVPLYNIFAVLVLVLEADGGGKLDGARMKSAVVNVCKNPIILGILAGTPFALLGIQLPPILLKGVSMVSNLATPLALLAIGAAFVWGDALKKAGTTIGATVVKLVALPAIFLPVAVYMGFRDAQLLAILIMLGSPTTATSYIMAKEMHNDHVLANGIVVLTTLLAAVTLTGWIFMLKMLSLI